MTDRLRLLVVDHDSTHRLAIVRAIEHSTLDGEVIEAASFAEGLAKLRDGSTYECVLIDQDLPDRGAIKLTMEIRGDGDPLPIILVTKLDDEDLTQQAIDLGVTDFYPKTDVSPRRLAFRIKFAIRVANAEAETVKSLDQATAAARARDEVLAIVSHDLRGPLHAISLATEALREDASAQAIRYLGAIERASSRAERLISDLLDASALENGKIALHRAAINLGALARQAALDHELQAKDAGGSVRPIVSEEPVLVWADRDRILQVLANLIGNAIKHARGTPIELTVQRREDWGVVTVTDRGPGIPAHEVAHVFDRYWSGRPKKGGAGLGLAIAKGIVTAHGGMITAASRPGEGARFEVALPLSPTTTLPHAHD